MPSHFKKTRLGRKVDEAMLDIWIKSKLQGRYFISTYPGLNDEKKLSTSTFVGFENEKELTYFMLACPYTRRN